MFTLKVIKMTIINEDSLQHPYAAIDVLVYEPLLTQIQVVKCLAGIFASAEGWPTGLGPEPSSTEGRTGVYIETLTGLVNRLALHKNDDGDDGALRTFLSRESEPENFRDPRRLSAVGVRAIEILRKFSAAPSSVGKTGEGAAHPDDAFWEQMERHFDTELKFGAPFFEPASLGLLQHYREHMIYSEVQAGPLEVLQPLAPHEKMEVLLAETTVRSWEQTVEEESEVTRNQSTETHDENELVDRVANVISHSSTTTVSASGNANWITGSASGSASTTVSGASTETTEQTVRRLQEVTRRQAEEIRKKTKITTRVIETKSVSTTTRHVIENTSNHTVNYGLRKLYYNVNVKIQDLAPSLVWQSVAISPGRSLAGSYFSDDPRKVPLADFPAPVTGTVDVVALHPSAKDYYYRVYQFDLKAVWALLNDSQKKELAGGKILKFRIVALTVRAVSGFGGGGDYGDCVFNPEAITVANFQRDGLFILKGMTHERSDYPSKADLTLEYTISPSQADIDVVQAARDKAQNAASLSYVTSRINFSAFSDRNKLEFEERKILLASALSRLVPPEIAPEKLPEYFPILYENFIDCFDLKQMFYDVDVTEWSSMQRLVMNDHYVPEAYELITKQETPARLGSALSWNLQIDGDDRRNMFLNAPWIRMGIPIKPGKERRALGLLARCRIPGVNDAATESLLREFDTLRAAEKVVAVKGIGKEEAVVTKGTVPVRNPRYWLKEVMEGKKPDLEKLSWDEVYPVVSEQHVVIPVQGFVYDEIILADGGSGWSDSGAKNRKQRPPKKEQESWWTSLWS